MVKKVKVNGVLKDVCVKVKAGILPDEDLYQQGRQLAKAGQYDWALEVLAASATTGDQARRQATVSAAMARMAEPAAAVAASVTASVAATEAQPPWIETRPMVGMAPETEPR